MKLLLKLAFCALLFTACEGDSTIPNEDVENGGKYKTDGITLTQAFDAEDIELMYQDGESTDSIYSAWRRFAIGNALRVKPLDDTRIEVANFIPVDIDSAIIMATIEGIDSRIVLFNISKIKGHARQVINYPFVDGQTNFLDEDGKQIDLSEYKDGIPASSISFSFTGETKFIKKLEEIKDVKWDIRTFQEADNSGYYAEEMTAKEARLFTGLMINYAYLYSSDRYKEEYMKEVLADNKKVVMGDEEKAAALQKLLDKPYYRLSTIIKVSGYAGGSSFGLARYILSNYLWSYTSGVSGIIAHELAHTLGYGHSSNMTYPYKDEDNKQYGFDTVTTRMAKEFIEEGLMPINMDNYYLPTDPAPKSRSLSVEETKLPACCKDCAKVNQL